MTDEYFRRLAAYPCCLGLGRDFQPHFLNNAFQKITSLVVTYSL